MKRYTKQLLLKESFLIEEARRFIRDWRKEAVLSRSIYRSSKKFSGKDRVYT